MLDFTGVTQTNRIHSSGESQSLKSHLCRLYNELSEFAKKVLPEGEVGLQLHDLECLEMDELFFETIKVYNLIPKSEDYGDIAEFVFSFQTPGLEFNSTQKATQLIEIYLNHYDEISLRHRNYSHVIALSGLLNAAISMAEYHDLLSKTLTMLRDFAPIGIPHSGLWRWVVKTFNREMYPNLTSFVKKELWEWLLETNFHVYWLHSFENIFELAWDESGSETEEVETFINILPMEEILKNKNAALNILKSAYQQSVELGIKLHGNAILLYVQNISISRDEELKEAEFFKACFDIFVDTMNEKTKVAQEEFLFLSTEGIIFIENAPWYLPYACLLRYFLTSILHSLDVVELYQYWVLALEKAYKIKKNTLTLHLWMQPLANEEVLELDEYKELSETLITYFYQQNAILPLMVTSFPRLHSVFEFPTIWWLRLLHVIEGEDPTLIKTLATGTGIEIFIIYEVFLKTWAFIFEDSSKRKIFREVSDWRQTRRVALSYENIYTHTGRSLEKKEVQRNKEIFFHIMYGNVLLEPMTNTTYRRLIQSVYCDIKNSKSPLFFRISHVIISNVDIYLKETTRVFMDSSGLVLLAKMVAIQDYLGMTGRKPLEGKIDEMNKYLFDPFAASPSDLREFHTLINSRVEKLSPVIKDPLDASHQEISGNLLLKRAEELIVTAFLQQWMTLSKDELSAAELCALGIQFDSLPMDRLKKFVLMEYVAYTAIIKLLFNDESSLPVEMSMEEYENLKLRLKKWNEITKSRFQEEVKGIEVCLEDHFAGY